MPVRRDATGTWRFQKVVVLPTGQRVRISGTPKINTKRDAEQAEREAIARASAGTPREGDVPTFGDFAARYMQVAALEQAPSELAAKRQRLAKVLVPLLGGMRIDRIGRVELDQVKLHLAGRAPRTINNYLAIVGAVLTYALECRVVSSKPDMGMLPVPEQDYEQYSDEEIDRLVAAGDEYERCAILLGGDAGLRAGEIRAVRREDVNAGKIRVMHSEWFGHTKAPKSGKPRVVPMTSRLADAVARCLRSHLGPSVLVRPNGLPWSREVMRRVIEQLPERAGVPNRGWHALRHAYCSRLAAAGVPARTIQALAGHASITTTERYMHVAPDALEAATSALERRAERMQMTGDEAK